MDSELDKGAHSVPPRFPVFVLGVKHHLGGAMIADSSPPIRAIKPPSLPYSRAHRTIFRDLNCSIIAEIALPSFLRK